MGEKQGNHNYLVQGSILAAASIIVRIIGLIYKIPMMTFLGDEGMGYYNTAYEIYNIALILSSYSLPVAVSKLVAVRASRKEYKNIKKIFNGAMAFATISGGIMTLILWFGADFIAANLFESPNGALPLKVMAPTILIFAIMGVFRGFFQGKGTMIPTSVSQIIEQVVHAIVSIWGSWYFMNKYAGQPRVASYGAAGGTLGTPVGAVFALIFVVFIYWLYRKPFQRQLKRDKTKHEESYKDALYILVLTITPIILSQTVYQLSGTVDNSMFGNIMSGKGFDEAQRSVFLGIYGGKYRLLSNVPVAIASSLAVSVIPSIVTSRMQKRYDEVNLKVQTTIKFNMLLAFPCAVGLGILASPILQLLFKDSSDLSANLMSLGAIAVIFFSLSTVTNAVLQGIDLMRLSVTHSAISLGIHVVLLYIMLQFTDLGVYGLVIGNVTFALVVCILNWIAIGKQLDYSQEIKTTFILPAASSLIMGVATLGVYKAAYMLIHSNTISLFLAMIVAVPVYFITLLLLKTVTEEELRRMPLGRSLIRVASKFHLL